MVFLHVKHAKLSSNEQYKVSVITFLIMQKNVMQICIFIVKDMNVRWFNLQEKKQNI
jgi:hypothetical protein